MKSEFRIADAAVQADAEGCLKLIVENSGYCHMELEEGMKLGTFRTGGCSGRVSIQSFNVNSCLLKDW